MKKVKISKEEAIKFILANIHLASNESLSRIVEELNDDIVEAETPPRKLYVVF